MSKSIRVSLTLDPDTVERLDRLRMVPLPDGGKRIITRTKVFERAILALEEKRERIAQENAARTHAPPTAPSDHSEGEQIDLEQLIAALEPQPVAANDH